LEVTSSTGCSSSETILIQQGTAVSDATIQATGPFIISDSPQQLIPVNPGGNWLSNCSTCLSASGMFDPQVAGEGIWEICYAIGSGTCSDSSCIFIEVTPGCLPQLTAENFTICSEDSIQVFGNWEFQTGDYSQSFIDILGCDSTHTITLNHFDSQNSSETLLFCENDSVFVFGTWHFSAGTLLQAGITQNGCAYTSTVNLIQEICNVDPPVVFIPNVFTPDGDFVNEIFKLEVLGGIIEEGYVFNRWGNTVFTFNETTLEWDGNDQKTGLPVQDGVYTYLVYFKPAYSPLELYHGFVTIIR
jgi:gliding motility-associated-like protein